MKTLVLNGSPHPNGDTAALLKRLEERLNGEVVCVDAYRSGISPCVDCRRCWKMPGCAIEDGMQTVYRHIEESDAIVIASPLYFSELTPPLLGVCSRLQTLYCAWAFRGEARPAITRRGGIVLVGGGDGSPKQAENTAEGILRHMGARCVGMAKSLGTNHVPAAQDSEALRQIDALARALNGKN